MVKLRLTRVYIIFLISAKNLDCGFTLEPLVEAVLTTHIYQQIYEKYENFLSENFHFFGGKIFSIFVQASFRNEFSLYRVFAVRIHAVGTLRKCQAKNMCP